MFFQLTVLVKKIDNIMALRNFLKEPVDMAYRLKNLIEIERVIKKGKLSIEQIKQVNT